MEHRPLNNLPATQTDSTRANDDEVVMGLVELALSQPNSEREGYLRNACGKDTELLAQVWHYVQAEQRMQGFLLEPLYPPVEEEHPFEEGQILDDRFRILREVARGGMGIVYEAYDEKLDRRIAIKSAKTGFHKRLSPEVRNASEISHPNVCKIFEIHTAPTNAGEIDFITMEFLDGETLADRLRRGKIASNEARLIAGQLCAGLAEAHRNRVVHGDLKSSNVILTTHTDGSTRAVITDFGLARKPQSAQRVLPSGAQGGTPDYMAPELWKGEKATTASDIYALGVILYELVSGRRPFTETSDWEQRLTAKPLPVDPRWDRILARCLDPNPDSRFQSADEITRALEPRSRRWLLSAAAALVLATLTGFFTFQRANAPQETVRLAVLPFEADSDQQELAERFMADFSDHLAGVKTNRTKLILVPLDETRKKRITDAAAARSVFGATHAISVALRRDAEGTNLRAILTDTRSLLKVGELSSTYSSSDLKFAPVALAGVVTGTFHLPPVASAGTVLPAAYSAWSEGLTLARGDPKDIDRAVSLLERATSIDADSPLTHAALAEAEIFKYQLTGDKPWLDRAQESQERAELRNPDLAPVRYSAGLIQYTNGRYDQAEASFSRAIETEPMNGDYRRELGRTQRRLNRLAEAVESLHKAIELQPASYQNYRALGAFYFDLYQFPESAQQYKKMVDLAPGMPDSHFQLARPYLNMGRYADAETELRVAISLGETSDAYHSLAVSLMYQDRDREAIPYYLKALELKPRPANKYLLYLNLGTSYRRSGEGDEAKRAYRQALELAYRELEKNPSNGYIRSCLAYLSARLGDRKTAESNAVQALGLSPGDVTTSWMVALTDEALGQRDKTLALVQSAPNWLLDRLNRFPDLADLQKDPRFQQIVASNHVQ